MQRNYEDARITLVHDVFLRNWEWINAEIACFAITISPWFSRGWTALELARSRKVKIVFKGGIIKDLDEDILEKPGSGASPRHQIVSQVIKGLRNRSIAEVDQLLRVLGPRHTSWPRDVAIISGQLVGVTIGPGATQQAIYRSVLRKIGKISHENLFHNSVTMSKEFTWCPTNLFNVPQSSSQSTLIVQKNGDVTGDWDVFRILERSGEKLKERYNWKGTHPLVEAKIQASLKRRDEHVLLVNPNDGELISMALLVKVPRKKQTPRVVQFVGSVYFQPPLAREEYGSGSRREEVTIAGSVEDSAANRQAAAKSNADFLVAAADGDLEKISALSLQNAHASVKDGDGNNPLHLAAQNGHVEAMEVLMRLEQFSLGCNKFGKTALHLAAQNGHGNVVEFLTDLKVDPNVKDRDSWTPLHHAAWKCYDVVVQKLLDAPFGTNWWFQDRLGQTALHLAAERGNVNIVTILLQKGADVTVQCDDGQTVLHRAAWGGSKAVMMELLSERTGHTGFLDLIDKDGRTALHIAAEKGNASLVELLLGCSATPDIQDNMEQTPLHLAAQSGHLHVAMQLVDKTELELEDKNGLTPLLVAIKNGHADVVSMLIKAGSNLESQGGGGRTPLMWAAAGGHTDVVILLMDKGADVKTVDSDGQTPLLAAAENGHTAVVEVLLEQESDFEFKVSGGRTPLFWAAEKGHEEIVRLLRDLGADTETRDANDQTPLIVAARYGHEAVVRLLLQQQYVDRESKCKNGRTALAWAAIGGHEGAARALLEHGAIVDACDGAPLGLASNHPAVIKLLLQQGASLKLGHVKSDRMLLRAAAAGHEEVARLLIESGANINCRMSSSGKTPIMEAIDSEHVAVVKMLLSKGADVEIQDNDNQTPLWQAAEDRWKNEGVLLALLQAGARLKSAEQGGQVLLWALENCHNELAQLLLDRGADPNYANSSKDTPLGYAAKRGDIQMMQQLFNKGARATYWGDGDDNRPLMEALHASPPATAAVELLLDQGVKLSKMNDWQQGNLLQIAVKNGHARLVKRLLKSGAKVDHTEFTNRTTLSLAVETGSVEIVEDLLDYGANVEAADYNGQTPLFFAVGNIEAVRLLLNRGANPEAKNIYGRTPLSRAVAHGHKEVVKLLSGCLAGES
jgi:ankyrin repeat protein